MLALLALLGSAQAEDILLVDATPVTLDDFSVAGLFYGMVVSAAEEEGLSFADADAIRAWAGDDADTCWDVDTCPANLWDRTNARLAVVLSVGQSMGGLEIAVRLHGVDEVAPFKVIREVVGPGEEATFADTVARAAKDALPLLPARRSAREPVLVIEDEFVPGDRSGFELPDLDAIDPPPEAPPPRADTRADTRGDTPEPGERRAERAPRTSDTEVRVRLRADEERRRMGIHRAAYARYEQSGLSREDWLRKARVRAGRGFIELNGGYGLGDIDRGYGVRLRIEERADSVDSFDTIGTTTWEGAGAARAPNFGVTLGYAPAWFLDTSVAASVQLGSKHLDTGWECVGLCDPPASEFRHEPVQAMQVFIEPRIRVFPVATGLVKPYAIVAFSVLLHDGFDVPDPEFVDYPNTLPGASLGPTAGFGLAIDPTSWFTIYAEVPGTLLLTPAQTGSDGEVTLEPDRLESGGYVLRFVGGIGIRL